MRKSKTNTKLELIRVLKTVKNEWSEYDDGPDLYTIKNKLERDFKVQFDLENQCEFKETDFSVADKEGYIQINGTWMYIGWAGGDWENPVYFVLYLSPKGKLRAYIPNEGNCYNKKYMMAYGNNDDDDDVIREDFDVMIKNITERIEVEPGPKTDYDIIRDLRAELEPYGESEGCELGEYIDQLCNIHYDGLSKKFIPHYIDELKLVLKNCKEQTEIIDGEIVWN